MSEPAWDRASLSVALDGRRRPEMAALRPSAQTLPDLATLFAFMRDAEMRFRTLRLRIEDRTWGAAGERCSTCDVAIRHPGHARVTTRTVIAGGAAAAPLYDVWTSDGVTVRTYSGVSKVATARPARRPPAGLDSAALPGRSRVYAPVTPLPRDSAPDSFVHPAGLCQNVLATGRVWPSTTANVNGREGIVVECDHPRSVLVGADRPDHHLQLTADRATGIVLRLAETIGGTLTRDAQVVALETDIPIADSVFELSVPPEARRIY